MKNNWSKNIIIAALVATNVVTALALLGPQFTFKAFKHQPVPVKMPTAQHASVVAAPFSNSDDELQACYKSLLAREAEVEEGSVQVHLTINSEGAVKDLELVHSDMTDSDFQNCIMDKIKTTKIEPTAERLGVVISHRFNFKKKELGQVSFDN